MRFCPNCEREFDDNTDVCPDDGARLVFVRVEEDPLVGHSIDNRYQVMERIGEGGMGTVYMAKQVPVGRSIALKVLRRDLSEDRSAVRRFFHEAKVVSKLRHPNTVTLYDFGQSDEGLLFIAMELMTGASLDNIAKSGGFGLDEVVEVGNQVCQALAEAHELDIIHRDLKPSNIFVDEVGARKLVKILDFGIAKIKDVRSNLTLTGMVFGTPAYMSPEQAQGLDIDCRTDLYALGVLLFELVTGQLPYPGESPMKIAMAHILQPIPDPEERALFRPLPPGLVQLICRLLAKEPAHRPPSANAVRQELVEIGKYLVEHPAHPFFPTIPDPTDSGVSAMGSAPAVAAQPMVAVRERTPPGEPIVTTPAETGPQTAQAFPETNPQPEVSPTAVTKVIETPPAAPPHAVTKVMKAPPPDLPSKRSSALVGLGIIAAVGALSALIVLALSRGGEDPHKDPAVVEPTVGPVEHTTDETSATRGDGLDALGSPGGLQVWDTVHDAINAAERSLGPVAAVSGASRAVRVTAQPDDARIVRVSDGETLCESTPCEVELTPGEDSLLIEARRRRFRHERVEISRSSGDDIFIRLERRSNRPEGDDEPSTRFVPAIPAEEPEATPSRFVPTVPEEEVEVPSDTTFVPAFPDQAEVEEMEDPAGTDIGPLMPPVFINP